MSDSENPCSQGNSNAFVLDSVDEHTDERTVVRASVHGEGPGRSGRARAYCFTWNRPPGDCAEIIKCWFEAGDCSYCCYQFEVGESGTPHLQGYIECTNPRTLGGLKAALKVPTLHLEQRRGTQAQAIAYCCKTGGELYTEHGTPRPGQGRRLDLETVKEDIKSGEYNELELVERHFGAYARYYRFFGMYRELRRRYTVDPSYRKKTVFYYAGETGTGKTSKALDLLTGLYPGYAVYVRPSTTGLVSWFPGLSVEHRGMIIDEFRSDIALTVMLRLLDGYPCPVETKGGFVETHLIETIVITSNYMPWDLYPKIDPNYKKPLYRRIDECYWFPKGDNQCPMPWHRTNELKALI